MAQTVKNLPAMWKTQVWSLGQEDTLEKGMATHSSILAWSIPWTEEPGKMQFMGSQRVRYWAINTFTFTTKLSYFSSHEYILRFSTYLWKWETFAYVVLEYKVYFLTCVASSCEFALILHFFFSPMINNILFKKLSKIWECYDHSVEVAMVVCDFLSLFVFREWQGHPPHLHS